LANHQRAYITKLKTKNPATSSPSIMMMIRPEKMVCIHLERKKNSQIKGPKNHRRPATPMVMDRKKHLVAPIFLSL
jgi:hypothetical protein